MVGFADADAGAQLTKGIDGSISWVIPENVDINEMTTTIETVQNELQTIQSIIGNDATDNDAATGLYSIINDKANADDVYTKDEIKNLISSVYKYCGSKPSYNDLPTEGQIIGDVWNIETGDPDHGIVAGDNVAWNGNDWDKLSGIVDMDKYVTMDTISNISEEIKSYVDEQVEKAEILVEKFDGGEI